MRYFRINKWFALCLVFIPFWVKAAVPTWEIIPEKSSLMFTATQNGAPVSGQFKVFNGDILFDLNDLKHSTAHIVIDINSLATSYGDLTKTLSSADWFNVNVFPKAEFKSTEFTKGDNNTYQAKGTLTIRDKSVPVVLTFTATQPSSNTITVDGSTLLKRSTFGVGQGEWSSTNEIKDDVNVNFKLVAQRKG